MHKLFLAGAIVLSASLASIAQDDKAPSKELIQYVQEATKLGLNDAEIQQKAVNAGWPAALVSDALASARAGTATKEIALTADPPTAASTPTTSAAPASAPTAGNTPAPTAGEAARAAGDVPPTSIPASIDVKGRPGTRGLLDNYEIGAGDVIQVHVWKEPDASVLNAVVRPDGKIAMPLLKEVEVVGLTPTEAEKYIAQRLSKFIPGADVTIVITGINSKKLYIVGAVKREGPIQYTYPMTIMQALSEAGGITDFAKRKKIYVLRVENGKKVQHHFDYDAALRGERLDLNIPLLPNDTLVIPH